MCAGDLPLSPEGQTRLHYRFIRQLGRGGMGVTFEALDTRLDRTVAIKTLLPEVSSSKVRRARLLQEGRAAAALRHPNICAIHSIEQDAGEFFIVMEYIEGRSLAQLVADGPTEIERVVRLALQIADGLDYAHLQGVVHRDIKPANIMVTRGDHAKILDFGLAKRLLPESLDAGSSATTATAPLTAEGKVPGTLAYMSPEQLQREDVDGRSDLFSFGVVLYELCTGRHPFLHSDALRTVAAILSRQPEPIARSARDVPPDLEFIILKCLRKDREHRYKSGAELLADLRQHLDGRLPALRDHHERPALAVLPFVDLSSGEGDDYFGAGVAGEITLKLAKMKDLRVMSRASSARFKGSELDLRDVGRELAVSTLVTGGFQRAGKRCRLTVELVDVSEGFASWADSYEVSLEDLFEVQDEVASRIAEALRLELHDEERSDEMAAPTRSIKAFEFYLQAKHAYHKFTEADNHVAGRLLKRALDLDPGYPQAHAALASTYIARVERGWETDAASWIPLALESAETAIRLDPRQSEAFSARGLILFLQKRLQEAEADIRRALELDPSNEQAHNLLGRIYFMQGELGRAEIAFRTALDINPFYVWGHNDLAWTLWLVDRPAEARSTLRRVLEISPSDEGAHTGLGALLYFDGATEKALAEFEAAQRSNRHYPFLLAIMPVCLARQGQPQRALTICREALELQPHDMVAHASLALVHSWMGDETAYRRESAAALELETFYTPFNLNFAIQYSFEGRQREARRFLDKALREGMRNPHMLRRHATLRQLLRGRTVEETERSQR